MFKLIEEFLSKILISLNLDFHTIFECHVLSLTERILLVIRKYLAILRDKRTITYLGGLFEYDNRFSPALLQTYPGEISNLNYIIGLKDIRTVLDIGANIGQYVYTLKKLYPSIRIYSFEPNPSAFNLLKKNLSYWKDIRLFNYAIGAGRSTKRNLYYSPEASAEGSFFSENMNQNYERKNITKILVNTVELNKNSLKRLNLPASFDLVKIDVEGAEVEVLEALKNISFRYLQIEVSLKRKGGSLNEVLSVLKDKGYSPQLVTSLSTNKNSPAANVILRLG